LRNSGGRAARTHFRGRLLLAPQVGRARGGGQRPSPKRVGAPSLGSPWRPSAPVTSRSLYVTTAAAAVPRASASPLLPEQRDHWPPGRPSPPTSLPPERAPHPCESARLGPTANGWPRAESRERVGDRPASPSRADRLRPQAPPPPILSRLRASPSSRSPVSPPASAIARLFPPVSGPPGRNVESIAICRAGKPSGCAPLYTRSEVRGHAGRRRRAAPRPSGTCRHFASASLPA